VETPLPSTSPHDHMILRGDLEGSHGRWKRPLAFNLPAGLSQQSRSADGLARCALQVALLMVGGGKAEVASRVLECQALPGALPAQMVRPVGGKLHYILDQVRHLALRTRPPVPITLTHGTHCTPCTLANMHPFAGAHTLQRLASFFRM
jgi:hypothetical protein